MLNPEIVQDVNTGFSVHVVILHLKNFLSYAINKYF